MEHLAAPPRIVAADDSRCAVVDVDHVVLASLLQLPPGCHIDLVESRADRPGTVRLRLRGAGWPVSPGSFIPVVRPVLTQHVDSRGRRRRITIDWGLPEAEKAPRTLRQRTQAGCLVLDLIVAIAVTGILALALLLPAHRCETQAARMGMRHEYSVGGGPLVEAAAVAVGHALHAHIVQRVEGERVAQAGGVGFFTHCGVLLSACGFDDGGAPPERFLEPRVCRVLAHGRGSPRVLWGPL